MFRRTAIASAAASALALAATPALAGFTQTGSSVSYTFSKGDSASASVDGFKFGAGYSLSFDASAGYDSSTSAVTAGGDASFSVPATFFDKSVNLFKIAADADVDTGAGEAGADFEVDVLGGVVTSRSVNLPVPLMPLSMAYTFISVDESFDVGPVPVTVSADATGILNATPTVMFVNQKLVFGLTPLVALEGDLSAGVGGSYGGFGASAGVEGSLTVLTVSVPMTVSNEISSTGLTTKLSGNLNLGAMSGDVDLYAKVCFVDCTKWTQKLFSWDGISWSTPLFSTTQPFYW